MNLLIHADPGARSGFVAAWLTNKLTSANFDIGAELRPKFHKIHKLDDPIKVRQFNGTRIRIRPEVETIDLHSLLFLRKNVYTQIPLFTRDEYSLETFTKLAYFSKEIFQWDAELDYSLYDYVLTFNNTFNNEYMIEFYKTVTGAQPAQAMIDILFETNKLNNVEIDKNHACSILKLTMLKERELGLKEENRLWSVVDVYSNEPVEKLHDLVLSLIKPDNYSN